MKRSVILLALLPLFLVPSDSRGGEWSEAGRIVRREGVVVSYRAKLEGDWLVVEVTHAPDWHTYAMDNVQRAQKRSGKERPECELPTRIDVTGGLKIAGNWRQTEPEELSNESIKWYTWGFNGTARFAVRVERAPGDIATVTVNAQSCNASSCSMVDGMQLTVPLPSDDIPDESSFDATGMVEVPGAD